MKNERANIMMLMIEFKMAATDWHRMYAAQLSISKSRTGHDDNEI